MPNGRDSARGAGQRPRARRRQRRDAPGLGNYLFDVFQRMVAAFGKLQSKLREEICRRRGHRPARLDGQASQATVAEEVMEYGKTENLEKEKKGNLRGLARRS